MSDRAGTGLTIKEHLNWKVSRQQSTKSHVQVGAYQGIVEQDDQEKSLLKLHDTRR